MEQPLIFKNCHTERKFPYWDQVFKKWAHTAHIHMNWTVHFQFQTQGLIYWLYLAFHELNPIFNRDSFQFEFWELPTLICEGHTLHLKTFFASKPWYFRTPLTYAVDFGYYEMAEILLQNGAIPDIVDFNNVWVSWIVHFFPLYEYIFYVTI